MTSKAADSLGDLKRSAATLETRHADATAGTVHEHFVGLLRHVVSAVEGGNYGIAAAAIVGTGTVEAVVSTENAMFSEANPSAHAEMRVLDALVALSRPDFDMTTTPLAVRFSDTPSERGIVLISTVEPCPMCTVALLNSGIDRVIYAVPDPTGGAIGAARQDRLPPAFASMLRHRPNWVSPTSLDPSAWNYLPADMVSFFTSALTVGQDRLDGVLERSGVLGTALITDAIDRWARSTPDPSPLDS